VEQGEAAARSPAGGTPGAAGGALSEWVTGEMDLRKANVRKEIRFRGGARSLFFYHTRPERRTSVGKRFRIIYLSFYLCSLFLLKNTVFNVFFHSSVQFHRKLISGAAASANVRDIHIFLSIFDVSSISFYQ
jgi:hypothetical protein